MGNEEDLEARREFLKLAALSAAGSIVLPGCSDGSAETLPPTKAITIIGVIDVAQTLADNALKNNLFWVDNNASQGSTNLGTDRLTTSITRNSSVLWVVSGLEVETSAEIASITGPGGIMANPVSTLIAPGVYFWIGKIPFYAIGTYEYYVTLNVENRMMTIPSPLRIEVK